MSRPRKPTGRRAARRSALFLLYNWDLTGKPLEEQSDEPVDPFALKLAEAVVVRSDELDRRIDEVSEGWPADRLGVLQQAFRRNHALQCGFCTAGILMSLDHYLARNPVPTEAEIRDLLSGHICRCTGYTPIIQAALEAAAELASSKKETSDA